MLADLLSADGEEVAVSTDGRLTRPAPSDLKDAGGEPRPQVLPGADDTKTSDSPQVLPGAPPAKDGEPLILPDIIDAKALEPQILPGTEPATDTESPVPPVALDGKTSQPLVLPGSVDAKTSGPQVLPGTAPGKAPEPLVLPDSQAPKGPDPQVLPGTTGKAPQPQVLPATPPTAAQQPAMDGEQAMAAAQSAPAPDPARPAAGTASALLPQQPPPPLKALAERTSRPLDETRAEPSPSATDGKSAGPTTSPPSGPVGQPARPAPQTVPTPVAANPDGSLPAGEEGSTSGGSMTAQTEVAAARDHSLSTLSRASIDATAQIAAQIQRRLEGRSTRFEIALRPAELGRVDVKLDIDAEGRLSARLAFDNPAAATDLRGRVDDLRRQLEAAGFELADDALEFTERDSGSSAFDRGQDARDGQNRAFAAAARLKSEIDIAQPPQWLALSLSPSGVDMKV